MTVFSKALALLTPRERRRGSLVLAMVILMALLETAGVASIMPFLAVLGNPEVVHTNAILASLYEGLGFTSTQAFLMALGGAIFALMLISAVFRILTHYVMNRFIEMRRHSLGERLLETYLRQPYAYFLNRHSGDMAKSILSEVDQVVGKVFRPGLTALSHIIVALALITLLLIVDPLMALAIAAVMGGLYVAIYLSVQGLLGRIGRERANANRERFTTAGEALGGIKDIKLLGREYAYLSRFRPASVRFSRHVATSQTLSQVPRYGIEAVAIGGVLALTLFLMATIGNVGELLPILGLYAFAGYKLMPALQHIYSGMSNLRFGAAAVDDLHEDLTQRAALAEIHKRAPSPFIPQQHIQLNQVSYTYPNAPNPALNHIDLSIPVGQSVGLVGSTGAGKTTLVDLILGLLQPTQGHLSVDNTPITRDNLRAWQQTLGYVPQDIFLSDASITENIALGIPREQIDPAAVERAARMAQVHDFIVNDLPQGYDTEVGERGVRLSGGQRQRIGIARALYHDPAILVFDEATSALDNVTEKAVMEAINSLHEQKTIILIAHRLSTVKGCDRIYMLQQGEVVASGGYEELLDGHAEFKAMAGSAAG
ncbi:ABC transporter ATP-binding protein [Ectothiorhodospira variabilis]|uniref:ABC transporter ATP-binding protein n=1 Tax=Ectothiorhodospira variabilis TaxID=505694 RepID=UPI001EFB0198|nr:ABC transporter ATP-binding protein/permease [Ectothiorhodospira variabilis]